MITKVIMPKLGETMEEGILNNWLKKEGDKVTKGEVLFEVITDKATFEAEAPANGYLRKILCKADPEKNIAVVQTIGYIADSMDEGIPAESTAPAKNVETAVKSDSVIRSEARVPYNSSDGIIKASPIAKRLAQEKRIDLSKITGTGPGGRITEKDVLEYKPGGVTNISSEDVEVVALTGIRKTIAQRLSQSKHDAPHYYLQVDIDVSKAVKKREEDGKKYSYNDIVVKATAQALEDFPLVNSTFESEKILKHKKINVGVAMMVEDRLIVPVLKDTNKKTIQEISNQIKDLHAKASGNKLTEKDFSGGTFTVSNLGMYGIDRFTAIINPPQVGILAVGRVKEVPVVKDGKVIISWMMSVSASFDHRVVDGAYGAQFLGKLKNILEDLW